MGDETRSSAVPMDENQNETKPEFNLNDPPPEFDLNEPQYEFDLNEPPSEEKSSLNLSPNEVVLEGVTWTKAKIEELTFECEEEAFDWYLTLAFVQGFGVRRDTATFFDPEKKHFKSRLFSCCRKGLRLEKNLKRKDRKRENKDLTRCECEASLRIARVSVTQSFSVARVTLMHTHELANEDCTSKLRSHRKVSQTAVDHILSLKQVGIRTSQAFQLMVSQAGGYGKVGYNMKDVHNKLQTLRKAYSNSGDGQLALQYIDTLKITNHGVYKSYTLREDNQLLSLFWCDRRSQIDYDRFGDVLIFDSTYKTNVYQKPIVILSGVNNHFQTCVFALGILKDETIETYKWELQNFLKAMKFRHPISVITDGDPAMKNAINQVFPKARHRLCAWHLCQSAERTLKLGADFMKDFGKCLKKRTDIRQWNEHWQFMVDKWNIGNKKWTGAAYLSRESWAEAYLKDIFFAGMTTTQRCKSINSFFKDFTHYKDKLVDLCQAFMRGLEKLRDNEHKENCTSDQSEPVLTTEFKKLEFHAACIYTRNVFNQFRKQAKKAQTYKILQILRQQNPVSDVYTIRSKKDGATAQIVTCYTDNTMHKCSCKRYEFSNLLCGHMIFVLDHRGVTRIPARLISQRWLKTDHTWYDQEPAMRETKPRICDDPKIQAFRRGAMASRMESLMNLGCTNQETYDFWEKCVSDAISKLNIMIAEKQPMFVTNNAESEAYADVKPPQRCDTKPKGCQKNTKKKCSRCKELGHNILSCPVPPTGNEGSSHVNQVPQPQSRTSAPAMSTQSFSLGSESSECLRTFADMYM